MLDFLLLLNSLVLTLPLVLAVVLHMVAVRLDVVAPLARPVCARCFGENKTWRGFALMPALGLLGLAATLPLDSALAGHLRVRLHEMPTVPLGLALGLAYVLFELPNSFLKRRMGIPPGKQATRHRWLFFALDHLDSVTGCIVTYALFLGRFPLELLGMYLVGPMLHVSLAAALHVTGIRKERY